MIEFKEIDGKLMMRASAGVGNPQGEFHTIEEWEGSLESLAEAMKMTPGFEAIAAEVYERIGAARDYGAPKAERIDVQAIYRKFNHRAD